MTFGLVLTTIRPPRILEAYARNALDHGRGGTVRFYVVADRKTPAEAADVAREVDALGIPTEVLEISAQEAFLQRFDGLADAIPYDSDNRRNVGYLKALADGADVVISIDDDNHVLDGDYFGAHAVVGRPWDGEVVRSANGWVNGCRGLVGERCEGIYPRGFPVARRRGDTFEPVPLDAPRPVLMNAGLWLQDPDVDAATRIAVRPEVAESRLEFVLAPGQRCPVNSQNTAVARRVVPAYYYFLMGVRIGDLVLDRFGDILQGLCAGALVAANGGLIRFGSPVVRHRRNAHDLLSDFRHEVWGVLLTERYAAALERHEIRSIGFGEGYLELADLVERSLGDDPDLPRVVRDHFRRTAGIMRSWVEACRVLGV